MRLADAALSPSAPSHEAPSLSGLVRDRAMA